MARIRTIKPEFFTSEDIVGLSPLARLLYIALWCEADREGRMVWKPATLKMRYLPADDIDIQAVCNELTDRKLVVRYSNHLAFIPTFRIHQHVNPREAPSSIPEPDASVTREHASNLDRHEPARVDLSTDARVGTRETRVSTREHLDLHAQGGREGKEGKGREGASRTRPPVDKFPKPNGNDPGAIQRRTCRYCTAEAVSNVNGIDHCREHADQAFDNLSALEVNTATTTPPAATPKSKFADA